MLSAFTRRSDGPRWSLFALVVGAFASGCSVPKDSSSDLDSGAGPDGGFHFDTGADSTDHPLDANPDVHIDPDAACGSVRQQADVAPVDLYVMFDKSSSMATKWTPATNGLKAFLKDTDSAGLRVALNVFPRPPDSTPACDQAAYSTPKVAFDVLPTNADPIIAAMTGTTPDGFGTPMYPALGGAILATAKEVKARPGDRGAVLLVTDGEPVGPAATCGGVNPEDPAVIATLAKSGVDVTGILTFVIGLPGVNLSIANQIAAAGGTTSAILVVDPTKIETDFRDALLSVRGKSLPCEFALPAKVKGGEYTPALVNVQYTKGDGTVVDLYQVADCTGAPEGSWRYDDPTTPTKIILCASTCSTIHGDFKAKIDILLGCKTKIR